MSATASLHPAEGALAATDAHARKEDAAEVLRMVFGEDVLAAVHEGFLKGGDFTAVVPLLVGPGARPIFAAAVRAALKPACDNGEAGVARLLLGAGCVRAEDANAVSAYVGVQCTCDDHINCARRHTLALLYVRAVHVRAGHPPPCMPPVGVATH